MARRLYSDEDVLNLLRQIDLSLAPGISVEMACRSAGQVSAEPLTVSRVTILDFW
jgi:DNA-binding transcriptional MerR regulator